MATSISNSIGGDAVVEAHAGRGTERLAAEAEDLARALRRASEALRANDPKQVASFFEPRNTRFRLKQRRIRRLSEGVGVARQSIASFCRDNALPLSLLGAAIALFIWNSHDKKRGRGNGGPDYSMIGRSEVYDDWGDSDRRGSDQ